MQRTRGLDLIGPQELDSLKRQVQLYVDSGKLAKRANNVKDALLIALKGRELGMQPLEALAQIYVVNGVTTCMGQGLLALLLQSGKVLIQYPVLEDEHVTVYMARRNERGEIITEFTADWTRERAEKAGLWNSSDSWKKYPRTMLKWKGVGEGSRTVGPDLTGGMYVVEEFGVQTPDEITPEMVSFTTGREAVGSEVQEQVKARFDAAKTPENTEALKAGLATILSQAGVTRVKDLTAEEVAGIDRLIAKYTAQPDPEPPAPDDLPDGVQEGDFEPAPDPEPPALPPTQAKRLVVPPAAPAAEEPLFPDNEHLTMSAWRAICHERGYKATQQSDLCYTAFGEVRPADSPEDMALLCATTVDVLEERTELKKAPAAQSPPTPETRSERGDETGKQTEAHGTLPLA